MTAPRQLHVFFTMDCERAVDVDLSRFNMGGPPDWSFSEKTIRRFSEVLREEGFVATYFVVPDTARAQSALWRELTETRSEVGLHLHPQGFGHMRRDRFFGDYDEPSQLKLLAEATSVWAQALGRAPEVFRPGNFSGSPGIFPTLLKAGLVAGSVSLPGRVRLELGAQWAGFGTACRLMPREWREGAPFLEIPVSASLSEPGAPSRHDPKHLRVEARSMTARDFEEVIAQNLDCPLLDERMPRTLVVMTHNTPDYTDPAMEQRLRDLVAMIHEAASARGMAICNTTMEGLRRQVLR